MKPQSETELPPYVQPVKARGRIYYYFRRGAVRITLPGYPGTREFQNAYDAAMRDHGLALEGTPLLQLARGGGPGSVAWVIERYKQKSAQWATASKSTRAIYDRRHHWLTKNYGLEPIAAFDREAVKMMRDLPEFADKPSVADANIERLAALWDFAEEFLHLPDMRAHKGINPARNIKKLKTGESESAPLWPLEFCRKFETYRHPELVTFYYLARYTGQRRSDLVNMQWDHIDEIRNEMVVAQIKTGARIWVPMPKPLRDYLETWPRRGLYIVMSTKTLGAPWRETSLTNEFIRVTRELGFSTADSKGEPRYYSPHGLRHLCGVELAHAGASDRQIAAVLGHSTLKQVQAYVKQAEQRILARDAQRKRDQMYEREVFEAAIEAAGNVTRLRSA
jgi:integrase